MILSKSAWKKLTGEARTEVRFDELTMRLNLWEEAQHASWAFSADVKGAELSERLARLEEGLSSLAGIIEGVPDIVLDEARLAEAEHAIKNLTVRLEHAERACRVQGALLDAALHAAGFQKYDEDRNDWPAWFFHVTGKQPEEI
jgi:hypothetical protein